MSIFKVILLISISITESILSDKINPDNLVVRTTEGLVRGTQNFTVEGHKNYFKFSGIPFAKPPVGKLRFKPPKPAPKRPPGFILNTTEDASECVQGVSFVGLSGSEDCLYLNIYTPILPALNKTSQRLSVMVFIYGGFFLEGNNSYSLYGPDFFLDENVIVVTLNYRLGVFGFLSTEDLVVPGNNGLKDQLLAAKWVKRNIGNFGGNSENITIWGESAGAASVSYFLQSNLTKNLFQAAIMESGTTLCPWALAREARNFALLLGRFLFQNTKTSKSLVAGLRRVPYQILQTSSMILQLWFYVPNLLNRGLPMGPVIEPEHEGAFFTGLSFKRLNRGDFIQVPSIIGFNSMEAQGFKFNSLVRLFFSVYLTFNLKALTPVGMNAKSEHVPEISNIVKEFYWGDDYPAISLRATTKYASDEYFNRAIWETVRLQSKYAPVYFYEFAYVGRLGSLDRPLPGVTHSEELNYLFLSSGLNFPTKRDKVVRRTMVRMWTNFAKCGSPTCLSLNFQKGNLTWLSARDNVSNGALNYYLIDNSGMQVRQNPRPRIVRFWRKLFRKYGNPPYATY